MTDNIRPISCNVCRVLCARIIIFHRSPLWKLDYNKICYQCLLEHVKVFFFLFLITLSFLYYSTQIEICSLYWKRKISYKHGIRSFEVTIYFKSGILREKFAKNSKRVKLFIILHLLFYIIFKHEKLNSITSIWWRFRVLFANE